MSSVPRSMQATTPQAAAAVGRARAARPNGWWGMVVLVATEATLFGTIFGTYFYLRFRASQWPPPGIAEPKLTLPIALTAVLVATSLPLQLASSAAGRARVRFALGAVAAAALVQMAYLAMQVHLFAHDLPKFPPRESAYGSIYFTMLGVHHAHVLVGILLEVWLFVRLASGLTNYRLTALRALTFYWHFVNVLALLVLLTQISPSL